ncbi:serine hydrolase domain-containing protein [Amphibacillus sediminis]|uniref:serine hydrolase domain-containing protein n=1 Tax=Amphibacillus sediminis TaxID=360185 RepID=UPI00082AB789|nr:serine hydrolase domain-containing protein [Amphibacillus sediminis]
MTIIETGRLAKIFNKFTRSKSIHEGILLIENSSGDFSFIKNYGTRRLNSPLLMASITKLFTTACILIFLEQNKLSLEDNISKYLDGTFLKGIHVYKGKDYTMSLTLAHFLFQTSGLSDAYVEGKNHLRKRVIQEDFDHDLFDMIALTKKLPAHFVPGQTGKAYYADINFDILGEVIKKVSGLTLSNAFKKYIFEPLKLKDTYLPVNKTDNIPHIYYKNQVIHRPSFVLSSGASGGCITTVQELMIFIKAFFAGNLFNKSHFRTLSNYNKLQTSMMPIRYGGGYMQIPLNGLACLFMGKGELIGHSGSTGSFAFYYPTADLFFVGDLNQMANATLPIRLSIQLAMAVK